MMPERRRGPFVSWSVLAFAVVWLVSPVRADGPAALRLAQTAGFQRAELFIDTAGGERRFDVEVARTLAQRARGLMFRSELAADAGLLFVFETDGEVAMWMKNTIIPLDILFVAADGRITRIAANATPLSETIIASGAPVRAVLEVPAGTASRLGIKPGDRVRSDAIALIP